jgi:hypothetical protein
LLRSPAKRSFKCLIKDTPFLCGVTSINLKIPKKQDDCKEGTLSNQPRLMRVTPTALLGSWGRPRPVNVVTHLFGDGDLDAGHCMGKPPTAKEFVARKTCSVASSEVSGTHWNRIKCKERLGKCPEAVIGQATINLYSQVWKSL